MDWWEVAICCIFGFSVFAFMGTFYQSEINCRRK